MFDLLVPVERTLLVEAVYYATRLIKHRLSISDAKNGLIVRGLASEPSPEGEEIALKVIEEIERIEGASLQKISKEGAEKYISALADIVHQRSVEDLRYDRERGQELLEELRKSALSKAG